MKVVDITGKKVGKFKVITLSHIDHHAYWFCQCECGNQTIISSSSLKRTKSCGCLLREGNGKIHGEAYTVEYRAWKALKARCFNSKHQAYKNYGGRGITVCDRWLHSYENFLTDMGRKPSKHHSLDRIDNDGNYSPSNCRWATPSQQIHNRRNVLQIAA